MVGAVGVEPTTNGLKGRCSATELRPCGSKHFIRKSRAAHGLGRAARQPNANEKAGGSAGYWIFPMRDFQSSQARGTCTSSVAADLPASSADRKLIAPRRAASACKRALTSV